MRAPTLEDRAVEGFAKWNMDRPEVIAVDTETTGLNFDDVAFCVTIAWADTAGGSIPMEGHYFELAQYDARPEIRTILTQTPRWVFHNSKFDLQKLLLAGLIERHEVGPNRFDDTEAMAHLLDEHRRKGLKFLAQELLGDDTDEEVELKKVRRELKLKKDDGYHVLPREVLIPYSIKDPELTLSLYHLFSPQLAQWEDLSGLYDHEKRVTLTLLDMESRGMAIDMEYVDRMLSELSRDFVRVELELGDCVGKPIGRNADAGEFNPASNPQLREYFEGKGFKASSYDKAFLASCPDPLAGLLVEYRRLAKIKNTYFEALKSESIEGVLHPWFRQHGTVTGRFSSGEATND